MPDMDRTTLAYLLLALLAMALVGVYFRLRHLSHSRSYRRSLKRDETFRKKRN